MYITLFLMKFWLLCKNRKDWDNWFSQVDIQQFVYYIREFCEFTQMSSTSKYRAEDYPNWWLLKVLMDVFALEMHW